MVRRPEGLYCPAGDFHIDPLRRVERAVITHAHADHARGGHRHYLATAATADLLRERLGPVTVQALGPGESVEHHGVRVSLHPAGHVLGSAQVRLAHAGRVWVASGDYYLRGDTRPGSAEHHRQHHADNASCAPFEPVRCDCFITESTFALPIYRWPAAARVFEQINHWWRLNAAEGRTSLLQAYSLGKAQQLLGGIDASIGPIGVHPAVEAINRVYRHHGVVLPPTRSIDDLLGGPDRRGALIIAPPTADGSRWRAAAPEIDTAFASGWTRVRGARQRAGTSRGFVLSNHADWPGLQAAIRASGASRVIVTHGDEHILVRWLLEQGLQAGPPGTGVGTGVRITADPETTA